MESVNQKSVGHRHGGMPEVDIKRLGIEVNDLLDFSVNLNPLGPPEIVQQSWDSLFFRIENYPGINGRGVSKFYEARFGIPPKNCLPGNGSTELIYLIPRSLSFKKALVIIPSYHDYVRSCLLAGIKVSTLSLLEEDGFAPLPMEALFKALEQVDCLWLGRPNNPTATLFPRKDIMELLERFPEKLFIVDEAFVQFLREWERESLLFLEPRPNLIVLHSLTKFYAIAGLRLGAVVSHEAIISRLRKYKEPWTVNGIAESVARLLIKCRAYEQRTREQVAEERKRLWEVLDALDNVIVYPAGANFLLCKWLGPGGLDPLMAGLLERGLYVRDCRNFPGLEDNFFRIGLKGARENDQLLDALREISREARLETPRPAGAGFID